MHKRILSRSFVHSCEMAHKIGNKTWNKSAQRQKQDSKAHRGHPHVQDVLIVPTRYANGADGDSRGSMWTGRNGRRLPGILLLDALKRISREI